MALRRKLYSGRNFRRALSIEELRCIARKSVPHFAFEYVECGAEDEVTLRWNHSVFETIRFVPSTLVDTTARHQRIELFGSEASAPLIIAPTAMNGIQHNRGDVALARAAAKAGIPFCLSTFSNIRLEDLAAEVAGRLWMQLYVMKDRSSARDIIARADRADYEALVLTSDANVFGFREWDRRNYREPGNLTLRNLVDVMRHPRWVFDVIVPNGVPRFENVVDFLPPEARSARAGVAFLPRLLVPDITWDDVKWLRREWPRKLILKGVLNVADALRAADLGCDGIVLTNHGGRQLDGCVSPMEVLPGIAKAVNGWGSDALRSRCRGRGRCTSRASDSDLRSRPSPRTTRVYIPGSTRFPPSSSTEGAHGYVGELLMEETKVADAEFSCGLKLSDRSSRHNIHILAYL
jgi:(S)-mandelate dehydrogenase